MCILAIYTGATALTLGAVPDGTGQIWLDNVNCRGTETRLISCPANPIGTHNCVHAEDAGVNCPGGTDENNIFCIEVQRKKSDVSLLTYPSDCN